MDNQPTADATIEELAARWPLIFGEDGLVNATEYEKVHDKAYSVEITAEGLRIGFAYDYDEVSRAFEDGADVVGRTAPDTCKIVSLNMSDGCIIYIDLDWDTEDNNG